ARRAGGLAEAGRRPGALLEGLHEPVAFGLLDLQGLDRLDPGQAAESAPALQPAADPDGQSGEVGLPGGAVVRLAEREPYGAEFRAGEDAQAHGAAAARSGPVHADHGPGDAYRYGGFGVPVAGPGLTQRGQVPGGELDGLRAGRAAVGRSGRGGPGGGDPGALGALDEGDERLGEVVAHAGGDGGVEGVRGAGGPAVVDGLAGRVQGVVEAHGEGAAGADGDEGGEAAAAGRGGDEDVVAGGGGRAAVGGAVGAGPGAGGEGGGGEGAAGGGAEGGRAGPGGGAQVFLGGPGGGTAWRGRGVAPPADLVAGHGEGDEDLAGGGGGGAGEGGEGLGEQVVAVGEGAAVGDQQAGRGVGGAGRGPPAVASGGAAAAPPAVAVQQGGEDGGVGVGGGGGAAVPGGFGGVRADGVRGSARGAVGHGVPPVPTRVMISHSARSSKTRLVGMRTVVRPRPVTGWPARLVQ